MFSLQNTHAQFSIICSSGNDNEKVYKSEEFDTYLYSDIKFVLKWHWQSVCKLLLLLKFLTEGEVLSVLFMTTFLSGRGVYICN